MIKELHRGEKVAIVVAACEAYQSSQESPLVKHGFFTLALTEALDSKFAEADTNKDGYLDSQELVQFVQKKVVELVQDQTPRYSPQAMGASPWRKRRNKGNEGSPRKKLPILSGYATDWQYLFRRARFWCLVTGLLAATFVQPFVGDGS